MIKLFDDQFTVDHPGHPDGSNIPGAFQLMGGTPIYRARVGFFLEGNP